MGDPSQPRRRALSYHEMPSSENEQLDLPDFSIILASLSSLGQPVINPQQMTGIVGGSTPPQDQQNTVEEYIPELENGYDPTLWRNGVFIPPMSTPGSPRC